MLSQSVLAMIRLRLPWRRERHQTGCPVISPVADPSIPNREPQTFHRNPRVQDLPADKFHPLLGEWRKSVVIRLLGGLQCKLNGCACDGNSRHEGGSLVHVASM